MGFIFNRNIINSSDGTGYNGYDAAITSWENSTNLEEKVMAINFKYDHRVSEERERHFRTEYFEPAGKDLLIAMKNHAKDEIRFRADPEFCRSYCANFIADCTNPNSLICEEIAKNTELATVVNLNGLSTPFIDSYPDVRDKFPELEDFEDVNKDPNHIVKTILVSTPDGLKEVKKTGFDDWLDTRLGGKTLDEVELFIRDVLKVLKYRFETEKFYHPVWVTKWHDFESYTNIKRANGSPDVDRWNQVVGVPRELDKWQIVLRYPASAVECLYRPTVLDGGCMYPQHFPSPPTEEVHMGGLTMDLGSPDELLLPEFIHKQIEIRPEYWIDAGRLIGKTIVDGYSIKLPQNRTDHHTKLKNKFTPPVIESWMKKAI